MDTLRDAKREGLAMQMAREAVAGHEKVGSLNQTYSAKCFEMS